MEILNFGKKVLNIEMIKNKEWNKNKKKHRVFSCFKIYEDKALVRS